MTVACAVLHGLSGVLLAAFWWLYAIVLPFHRLREGIHHLALDRNWTWISMIGGGGAILGSLALTLLWRLEPALAGTLGTAGVLVGSAGLSMLAGNLFWEAILWPPLARHDASVLSFSGPLYSSRTLLAFFGLAGLLFSGGFITVGLLLRDSFGIAGWCLALGAPAFALGPLFGRYQVAVRSAGITALAAGQIAIASILL
ncbi:MAG: hypothetical protein KDA24_08565 [Deltaproteobacteria bacterium]|nr:hypothetical protein [Deltaproteobacteria bacterium]